jgi:hypothetical protein
VYEYDDNYRTCLETYATLRITSDTLTPQNISELLTTQPTKSFAIGDLRSSHPNVKKKYYEHSGWFYCSKGLIVSRDCRRHIDYVVDASLINESSSNKLKELGCKLDIMVFYLYTQGGPTLSPLQMRKLANLEVEIWWDLYRADDDEIEEYNKTP